MTVAAAKAVRAGSPEKRAAILRAARELFASDGFDRTSMDAVSVRARVSKRTVYDYYGDKRTLLLAVVDDVAQSLFSSIRAAIDEHLDDDEALAGAEALEDALIAFAKQVAISTFGSSDYAELIRLSTAERAQLADYKNEQLSNAPEDAIAERLTHFAKRGLLEVPDPALAAEHFKALAFLLAQSSGQEILDSARKIDVEHTIAEGVRAFMRAYARRDGAGTRKAPSEDGASKVRLEGLEPPTF